MKRSQHNQSVDENDSKAIQFNREINKDEFARTIKAFIIISFGRLSFIDILLLFSFILYSACFHDYLRSMKFIYFELSFSSFCPKFSIKTANSIKDDLKIRFIDNIKSQFQ